MKTNHQRGYKEKRDPNVVFSRYTVFSESVKLDLSGRSVNAHVTCGDHTNGKRGIAKDRRGAKKFLHSRGRFHEKMALQKMVKAGVDVIPESIETI